MSRTVGTRGTIDGLAGWLVAKLRGGPRAERRLALLERIALGPRQSLALVEAEGRRILVATSAEGGPAFYPLGASSKSAEATVRIGAGRVARLPSSRVSW